MPAGELLAADDHLASCADCRALAWGGEAIQQTFASLDADLRALDFEEDEHLSYERIAAFVRRELDEVERETVESHLTLCDDCAGDVRDLSAFATQVQAPREPRPAPPVRPALGERLAAFWLTLRRAPALRFGLAAAVILVFVGAGLWWLLVPSDSRRGKDVAQTLPATRDAARATPPPGETHSPNPPESRGGDAAAPHASPTASPTGVSGAPPPAVSPSRPNAPRPSSGAPIVAALEDHRGRVTLDGDGRIDGLPALPPDLRGATVAALRTRRVQIPAAVLELGGTAGTLLSRTESSDTFNVASPVATAVSSTRPTLNWQPLSGASSYKVTVFDADFNTVAVSPPLNATSWVVPQPLRRGGVYRWQVSALKGGEEVIAPAPTAPEARFTVLDESALKELAHAEQVCRESHLACGVLYSRVGLLEEAEREFKSLADANPHSALARALLRAVRKTRRPK